MYLITYQKRNGDIFCRVRSSIPCAIGKETSMGWKVVDVKQQFKNNFYTLSECKTLETNYYKRKHFCRNFKRFFQDNMPIIMLLIILFLLIK